MSDRNLVPPSDAAGRHFRYRHAETGHVSEAETYRDWVVAAKEHRRAMDLPIPADFTSRMEEQLCGELPPEWCAYSERPAVDTGFSMGDALDWLKAVALRFWEGTTLVAQEEANRRATICARCPLNVNYGGCGAGCAKLVKYLTPGMLAKTTPYDDSLKTCGVCRCYNRVQAWFPLSVLLENDTPEKQILYPSEFCWKSERSPNFALV